MDPLLSSMSSREHHPMTGHFREKVGYGVYRPAGRGDWLVIYTLAGTGIFRTRDHCFLARAHDVVLIRPDAPHGYATATAQDITDLVGEDDARAADPSVQPDYWELLWAHFHAPYHWLEHLDWPQRGPGVMHLFIDSLDTRQKIIDHLSQAHRIMSGFGHRQVQLGMNAIEAALLWCDAHNPRLARARLDPRISAVMDWMSRRLDQRFSLGDLARSCHLSPSRFAHLFKAQTGTTPVQFLDQQRIARARQLLELTRYPIAQIARQVGFDNPFYFSRRFTKATGMSPRAFRARVQKRAVSH